MRFASLGSGSKGNALLVQAGETLVLLDCGFSVSETESRLASLGVSASDLAAILVTHEHGDHVGGVGRLARRYALPVWLTPGTLRAASQTLGPLPQVELIGDYAGFSVGQLWIEPFPVPHDAREPAQYVFHCAQRRLGVLTDAGTVTNHMLSCLREVDALVLECNHDAELLASGPYSIALKQRVGGAFGHLSNADAAGLLRAIGGARLQHVVAAHLSEVNNRPELARDGLAAAIGRDPGAIAVATQATGFGWREIA